MKSESVIPRWRAVPGIVRIVLSQAVRRRADGTIPEGMFQAQIHRLEKEELSPRGFVLLTRELSAGGTRFVIKDTATNEVRDLLEFQSDGAPEEDTARTIRSSLASSPRV
jgi:hypothetical protein